MRRRCLDIRCRVGCSRNKECSSTYSFLIWLGMEAEIDTIMHSSQGLGQDVPFSHTLSLSLSSLLSPAPFPFFLSKNNAPNHHLASKDRPPLPLFPSETQHILLALYIGHWIHHEYLLDYRNEVRAHQKYEHKKLVSKAKENVDVLLEKLRIFEAEKIFAEDQFWSRFPKGVQREEVDGVGRRSGRGEKRVRRRELICMSFHSIK